MLLRDFQHAIEEICPPGVKSHLYAYNEDSVSYTLRVMAGKCPPVISTLRMDDTITQIIILPDQDARTALVSITHNGCEMKDSQADSIVRQHIAATQNWKDN